MFSWIELVNTSFLTLKQAPVNALVLQLPCFHEQFTIETNACHSGVGSILMQDGNPVTFLSKALGGNNQGLSTYMKKECMATHLAMEKWRSYQHHHEFLIKTNHQSLAQLTAQRPTTSIQHKAFLKIIGLQYKIVYKKESSNEVVDAFIRKYEETQCNAISSCIPSWTTTRIGCVWRLWALLGRILSPPKASR